VCRLGTEEPDEHREHLGLAVGQRKVVKADRFAAETPPLGAGPGTDAV
jgi:hypothetical protein